MTLEQRLAHERLINSLPVREQIDRAMKPNAFKRKPREKRPLIIDGKRYGSIQEAAECLELCTGTIHHHLRRKRKGWRYA